jgi:DNA-directed RNA polymerase specialized sigma24 family protein
LGKEKRARMKPKLNEKPTFEDSIDIVDREIAKQRSKWTLRAISWMDYEDVAQISRAHIFKKWDLYDPEKGPLGPWLSRSISNIRKNIIRNHYSNFSRPCLKCYCSTFDDGCSLWGGQDSRCPSFENWRRTKKRAFDTKLPLPLENHEIEVCRAPDKSGNFGSAISDFENSLEAILSPLDFQIYRMIYIEGKSESEVAKKVKLKTFRGKSDVQKIRKKKEEILEMSRSIIYEN